MLNVPWGAVIASGCIIVYVVFIGVASFSPSIAPEKNYGFYQSFVENIPRAIERKLIEPNASSKSFNDAWDRCDLPKYDVWDEEIFPYINPDRDPIKNCEKSFKPLTTLKNSIWNMTTSDVNMKCKARCHTRKTDRSNKIGPWMYTPGPVECEILETVCSKQQIDVYGYLHSQVIPLSLPRTLSYFTNHMDGVIFPYMNKIGENSRPNGVPIWFGKSLEKVDKSLFGLEIVPPDWSFKYFCRRFKDNETSLFSEFHDYGYRTLLAEDWAEGTMNWPNCVGFDKPPIDHYMRPFQNAYERKNHGAPITQKHLKGGHLCREGHHTLLDYMGQFINAYPNQNKFGWMWAIDLGHNSENGFSHADKDFHNFLIRHRKTSHYDTRATILDIMKYQSARKFTETEPNPIPGEKGNSYIRRQPATPRNCQTLPVPLEYCICQFNKTQLSLSIGIALASAVNTQIENGNFTGMCIKMEWEKTLSLSKYDHQYKEATLYTVTAQMKKPSGAQFKGNVKIVNGGITVLGMVERSNRYGKTANCIKSEYHRPYCYCKDQNDKSETKRRTNG